MSEYKHKELSKGWLIKPLGEVCKMVRGPFGGSLKKSIFVDNGIAVYEQQHAIYNQFSNIRYFVNDKKFAEMRRFELFSGDLIMSCSGTMGKIAIVPQGAKQGIINQALLKLTPLKNLNASYLKSYMESKTFQQDIAKYSKGAAIKNVASVKILKQTSIPVPPLATQQKIVTVLDKTFKQIDKAITNTKQNLQNTQDLFNSSLEQVFNNPDDDWIIQSLGKVCEVIAGQSPEGKYYNSEKNGLPFYQGKKEFQDKYIGKPKKWTIKITKEAKKNDVLMSVRAPVGSINFATQKICIGRGLAAIRVKQLLDKDFLFNFLTSQNNQNLIIGNVGAVFNSINKQQIEDIKIPIPPLTTQQKIVKKLDALSTQTQALKQSYTQKLESLQTLKKSLLEKAFSGELI